MFAPSMLYISFNYRVLQRLKEAVFVPHMVNAGLEEIPVGNNPQTLSFDPSGSRVFVSNRDDDTVSVVDPETAEVITSLPVGDEPFGVVAGQNDRVYVANEGSHWPDAGNVRRVGSGAAASAAGERNRPDCL